MRSLIQRLLIILIHLLNATGGLRLESFQGPKFTELGSRALLSCQFSFQEFEEEQIDVKWYHNSSSSPILVWVPYSRVPYVLPSQISEFIELPLHRDPMRDTAAVRSTTNRTLVSSIYVRADSTRLSGEFTCKISTFSQEISVSNALVVYDRPVLLMLNVSLRQSDLSVQCTALGGFPAPTLSLCRHTSPHSACDQSSGLIQYQPTNQSPDQLAADGQPRGVSESHLTRRNFQSENEELAYPDLHQQQHGSSKEKTNEHIGSVRTSSDLNTEPREVSSRRKRTLRGTFSLSSLSDVTQFTCTLTIPGTNVSLEETETFNKYPTRFQPASRVSSSDRTRVEKLSTILIILISITK